MAHESGRIALRTLLMGSHLANRNGEAAAAAAINRHLVALTELLPKIYGKSEPCKQAVMEIGAIVDMADTRQCMACKRAMLLYAIQTENEACSYWKGGIQDGSFELACDLRSRVLPFLTPRFFKHSCQSPESYVTLALLMSEMWKGEDLANFPAVPP